MHLIVIIVSACFNRLTSSEEYTFLLSMRDLNIGTKSLVCVRSLVLNQQALNFADGCFFSENFWKLIE